jgi:ribose-phosphate pyrophosphokinase
MLSTKILNLADLEKSAFKYKVSRFPDGQQALDIIDSVPAPENEAAIIWSRINSFLDLELIISAKSALHNLGYRDVRLYVAYFLGARSDRKFKAGGSNYLKQVICPIINLQKFNKVVVLDPHSDVLEACLDNFEKIDNFMLVDYALGVLNDTTDLPIKLVSPDAGALKKIYSVSEHTGVKDIVIAAKVRDDEGHIVRTDVPGIDPNKPASYVIIDDICDGGRTFIEISKTILQSSPTSRVFLVVTHGIFSGGFLSLCESVNGIFTTNSVEDINITTGSIKYSRGQFNFPDVDKFLYQAKVI